MPTSPSSSTFFSLSWDSGCQCTSTEAKNSFFWYLVLKITPLVVQTYIWLQCFFSHLKLFAAGCSHWSPMVLSSMSDSGWRKDSLRSQSSGDTNIFQLKFGHKDISTIGPFLHHFWNDWLSLPAWLLLTSWPASSALQLSSSHTTSVGFFLVGGGGAGAMILVVDIYPQ